MIGTDRCIYETPCRWCSKWDKKCDRKIPERGQRVKINPVDDAIDSSLIEPVRLCVSESDHNWELVSLGLPNSTYRCSKCGKVKYE